VAETEGIGAAFGADENEENRAKGGADAVGLALALDAARDDPKLAPAVRRYLNRQRTRAALKKYRQALQHAPQWTQLKAPVAAGSST
jgi:hypothetical protein